MARPKGSKDKAPRKPRVVPNPKVRHRVTKDIQSPAILPYQTDLEPKTTTVRGAKRQKSQMIAAAKGKEGQEARAADLNQKETLNSPITLTCKDITPETLLGRPPYKWTKQVEDVFFMRISDGEPLKAVCREPGMPSAPIVFQRLTSDPEFQSRYAHARAVQADMIADEVLEIADDGRNDWMERHGRDAEGWLLNGEHTARSRLRIDARKWYLEKIAPKKYGNAMRIDGEQTVTHNISDDVVSFQEIANRALDRWKTQGLLSAPKAT